MSRRHSTGAWARSDVAALLLLIGLALLLRLYFYSGLSGSDDTIYAIRGLETSLGLWLPSDYVGDLRYGVNLPIAGFVTLLGRNMVGVHAWAMVCSLGEIVLVFLIARGLWGTRAAAFAALAMALTPLHIHAGGRALADAPLAFFFTLAFVSFYFAERDQRTALYWVAGLAIGFSWWIKPHAIVFCLAFLGYAALTRTWRREWWFVFAGATLAILLEFGLFYGAFGDPFYALKAMVSGIDKNFVKQDAPWGDHAPLYYFRQMFLDGRDMGFVPLLMLLAAGAILMRRSDRSLSAGGYAIYWVLALLAIFSFMPFSLSPFKLIPKQDNYALMFFAPVGLLAGRGLDLIRFSSIRWAMIGALVIVSTALAALPQYQVRMKYAALQVPAAFAKSNPGITTYVPEHVINLARAESLLHGVPGSVGNERRLGEILSPGNSPIRPAGTVHVFLQANWPEVVKTGSVNAARAVLPCLMPIEEIQVGLPATGRIFIEAIDTVRGLVPSIVAKHLAFTDRLQKIPPVTHYEWPADCSGPAVR